MRSLLSYLLYNALMAYIPYDSAEPNDESGANVDAAIMWREQREEFNKIAKRIVRKSLGLPS